MHSNEIRDFLERAPKRIVRRNGKSVYPTHSRLKWLADLAAGSIDDRINRRAGIRFADKPWHNPVWSACQRHQRKLNKRSSLI